MRKVESTLFRNPFIYPYAFDVIHRNPNAIPCMFNAKQCLSYHHPSSATLHALTSPSEKAPLFYTHFSPLTHNSFNPPVTLSITLFGAGPIPRTVWLPLAIWVLPASAITSATNPKETAVACNISISSSLLTCSATLAWPCRSQRRRMGELGEWRRKCL